MAAGGFWGTGGADGCCCTVNTPPPGDDGPADAPGVYESELVVSKPRLAVPVGEPRPGGATCSQFLVDDYD